MIQGIDVSNHQAEIDWEAVANDEVQFAFMKATEDTDYHDKWFELNWRGSKAAGLIRGAYHYANPDEGPPEASVRLFKDEVDAVGGLQDGDLIALDIESGTGDLYEWVKTWCEEATRVFGVKPFIYSAHWFMEPHGLLNPELSEYPLWYASWQATMPLPPYGWHNITVWQTSASGTVPGVNGDCDTDQFDGTADELRAYGLQDWAAPVPVDPVTVLRDQTWKIAGDWAVAGYPWTAEGIRAIVALNKGEK